MTTIAYSHKLQQIAVDSRVTSGGVIDTECHDKTIKNEHGFWFFCGSLCDYPALAKLKHHDKAGYSLDCHALVVNDGRTYLVTINDENVCEWHEMTFDKAIGSGSEYAISALCFGKTPKEAIEFAGTKCVYTGGCIQTFEIGDLSNG